MKRMIISMLISTLFLSAKAQVTTLADDYKIINIGGNGIGDYTHSVILLHEIYNGILLDNNYAIGTITAMRGNSVAGDRIDVVNVTTSSAYSGVSGTISSYDNDIDHVNAIWKLKTCLYGGKKYLAVDVPYENAFHNWGYKFSGATSSTGENMKCVSYLVNGQPVNQNLISNIEDYVSDMIETHAVSNLNITGNVGIGMNTISNDKLSVKGNIHAQQVTVDMNNWADYVFRKDYSLTPLAELKVYIDQHQHLPEIPSEKEITEKGLNLGEMNKLLTKKVEELTLYLIEKDKQLETQQSQLFMQGAQLRKQQDKLNMEEARSKKQEGQLDQLEARVRKLDKKVSKRK